jgi:hypothetical protein
MKITPLSLFLTLHTLLAFGQAIETKWDSTKTATLPVVASAFTTDYDTPYRQPLAAYGWEDGIHISRDGLHLYALYYPGDLLSWTFYFGNNVNTRTFCELFGETSFLRSYANTYGMDMATNTFGCSHFLNVDILYATRASTSDDFTTWQLSSIARPGFTEGGPYPLFSKTIPNQIDVFLFTGNNDIWMIRNTSANPANISSATRLPSPINPAANEFHADNPHLERLHDQSLLLVYEKYTNGDERDFMYAQSFDNGLTWTNPVLLTTLTPRMGKIEHPHLYQEPTGSWHIYFSLNCEIYRAKQGIIENWDSWQTPELVIQKGNSPCIGEPSLTVNGDISFAVVYNPLTGNSSTDSYDIDPWYLRRKKIITALHTDSLAINLNVSPNPFHDDLFITSAITIKRVTVIDAMGRIVFEKDLQACETQLLLTNLLQGVYLLKVYTTRSVHMERIIKR